MDQNPNGTLLYFLVNLLSDDHLEMTGDHLDRAILDL